MRIAVPAPGILAGIASAGIVAAMFGWAGERAGAPVGWRVTAAFAAPLLAAACAHDALVFSRLFRHGRAVGSIMYWTFAFPLARGVGEWWLGAGPADLYAAASFYLFQAFVGSGFGFGFLLLRNLIARAMGWTRARGPVRGTGVAS